MPALDEFEPDLLIVSAGFDAHERDPLAQMRMTTAGFRGADDALLRLGRRGTASGRLVLVTEGGYDLEALTSHSSDVRVDGGRLRRACLPQIGPRRGARGRRGRSRGPVPAMAWTIIRSWPNIILKTRHRNGRSTGPTPTAFEVTEDPSKPKFYCLEMFAYPSGHAHVGHVRNYIIGDVVARLKRLQGFNVLHPFGWDAFGLPAENAAIKSGIHPEASTLGNIAHMKGQLQRLGISYAWGRELATCLPDYYRWNQWLFIRMFETRPGVSPALDRELVPGRQHRARQRAGGRRRAAGAAARRSSRRTSSSGSSRSRTTPTICCTAPKAVEVAGKSSDDAAELDRAIGRRPRQVPDPGSPNDSIEVFTTRIDTIYGATFVMLAPEHRLVDDLRERVGGSRRRSWRRRSGSARRIAPARMTGEVEKEGFFTGRFAINPFTNEPVPIWVANYVLGEYGTGAVMAVPAHDERDFDFASQVRPADRAGGSPGRRRAPPARRLRRRRTTGF